MILKNIGVCLITINAPHSKVYSESSYDTKGELKPGAKPTEAVPGAKYDLKPAGAAVEIPEEVCADAIVKAQISKYLISGNLKEVELSEDGANYHAMGREDLESTAKMLEIEFNDNTSDEQLTSAIEAKSAG